MVTSNDINFVNSDLNNLIDEVVSSNPQLNNKIQKVKEESNLFICEILKFYTVKDKVQVRILSSNQVVTAHCTHDILSKDVSLKSMVKGVVNSDKNGATYIVPHSTIYGILAKVRYSGVTDEYCLISCVNFEDDFDLKSNVDSGEIRLTVGNSRLSVNDERINIMCPELFINGLPFSAPEFDNYHTVDDVNEIYNTLDESIKSVIVFGYYKDNNFYTTESYGEVIEKNNTKLFIDLATDTLYCVINDNYVSVGGGSSSNDYDVLVNKPCIDGVELTKESSSTNLGLATKYEVSNKQDKLIAGENISINDNVISASRGVTDYDTLTSKPSINNITLTGDKSSEDLGLQDKLIAGDNISIVDNVISSNGGGSSVQSDWEETDTSSLAYILHKPPIPTNTSDLFNDSDFISDSDYVHTDNNFTNSLKAKLNSLENYDDTEVKSDIQDLTTGKADKLSTYTKSETNNIVSNATNDMATQTWVGEQGYLTSVPVLSVNGKIGNIVLTPSDLGLGNVFKIKGSKPTKNDLPTTNNEIGDVWYVINESVGYIWLNDGAINRWEQLGLEVDLSNYATINQLNTSLSNYVQKVTGKELSSNDFTNSLKNKLERLSNYDDTEIRNLLNNKADTVHNHSINDVINLSNSLNNKVDKVSGKGLSTVDFTDTNYIHTDNNYTNSEKNKLASLENYDDTEVKSDIQDLESNKADKSDTYTKTETDSAINNHHDNTKVDKVTGKQLSTNDYSNSEKSKLASQNNTWFGTCSNASATASKVVTIDDSNFELRTGTVIGVKFTNSNTASNVTLNVNGTGAKQIWYNNAVYTSTTTMICGYANRTNYYMYDGTYWVFLSYGIVDSNTTYYPTISASHYSTETIRDNATTSSYNNIWSTTPTRSANYSTFTRKTSNVWSYCKSAPINIDDTVIIDFDYVHDNTNVTNKIFHFYGTDSSGAEKSSSATNGNTLGLTKDAHITIVTNNKGVGYYVDGRAVTWVSYARPVTQYFRFGINAANVTLSFKNYKQRKVNNVELSEIIDGKQDVISDLTTIRNGANKGSTAIQPNDDISKLNNDVGYLTSHQDLSGYYTKEETNNQINNHHDSLKQDVISDLTTIRAGANKGATALQPVGTASQFLKADGSTDSSNYMKETDLQAMVNNLATAINNI